MRNSIITAVALALATTAAGCVCEVEPDDEAPSVEGQQWGTVPVGARHDISAVRGQPFRAPAVAAESGLYTASGLADANGTSQEKDDGEEPDPTPWRVEGDDGPNPAPGRQDNNECFANCDNGEPDPTPWKKTP